MQAVASCHESRSRDAPLILRGSKNNDDLLAKHISVAAPTFHPESHGRFISGFTASQTTTKQDHQESPEGDSSSMLW